MTTDPDTLGSDWTRRIALATDGLERLVLIRELRERVRRDAFPGPNRGDAKQLRVEARPAVVTEIQHDAARSDVPWDRVRCRAAQIERRGEKRVVRLHPRCPRVRGIEPRGEQEA